MKFTSTSDSMVDFSPCCIQAWMEPVSSDDAKDHNILNPHRSSVLVIALKFAALNN